jgi:hypothetical protein
MINRITILFLTAFGLCLSVHANTRVELCRIGTHPVRIADGDARSQLIGLPFLKSALSRGRLDHVDPTVLSLHDMQGGFTEVDSWSTYILRVTDGSAVGAWFLLGEPSENGHTIKVLNDGFVANLSDLKGHESFAVHQLYTLSEIFPEQGDFLPASDIDLTAMQLHFFDGRAFKQYWLSNGTITEHVGWTCAENGELVYAGDTAILPGTSFLVLYPQTEEPVNIRMQGKVLDASLNVPIYPGYNFVASSYSKGAIGSDGFLLANLGLRESGFKPSHLLQDGDQVLPFDSATGQLAQGLYLDATTDEFNASPNFYPGDGFIIYNAGETYLWSQP